MFSRIKGTQDFLDLTLFNMILQKAKKQLNLYNFTEIATPIIESVTLFKRSLGTDTDVVSKEMFIIPARDNASSNSTDSTTTLKTQPSDDDICLRPEATASVVRAFVENNVDTLPWRVFTHGPMFRYERPQKGRYRQFHQISIEVIGTQSVMQDVELIAMLDAFFKSFGTHQDLETNQHRTPPPNPVDLEQAGITQKSLIDYVIQINFLGCQDDRKNYEKLLKIFVDKLPQHNPQNSYPENALPLVESICNLCTQRKEKNILRIFDCKNPICQKLYTLAPKIADSLCNTCQTEWTTVQQELTKLNIPYFLDPNLVRGLDYYSKTVFEFTSQDLGAQKTICGGGRYDKLVADVGGKQDQPSIGAAIGIERLILLLEPYKEQLGLNNDSLLHVIIPVSPAQTADALLIAQLLRSHNLQTQLVFDGGSVKSMMRKANKLGADFCLVLGQDEQEKGEITVKNMAQGTEARVKQEEVLETLR